MPLAFLLTIRCGFSSLCAHITRAYRGTGDKTLHILNLDSGWGCNVASRFGNWTPRVGCRSSLWQIQYSLWYRILNVSMMDSDKERWTLAFDSESSQYVGRRCQCCGCQILDHAAKLHMWQSVELHVQHLLWLPEFSVAASICFVERYWQDCLRSSTHIKTTRFVIKLESFYQTYYTRYVKVSETEDCAYIEMEC